jgi:Flp pilus assembly protein TadG
MGRFITHFRTFARARSGATAVEFAIVAMPFLFLLMGILQIGLIFFVQTDLDNAASLARRTIRTGEFQQIYGASGTSSAQAFRTLICNTMTVAPNCSTDLSVDVAVTPVFTGITYANRLKQDGTFDNEMRSINTGKGSEIVVVTISYRWPLYVPLVDQIFQTTTNGERIMVSTIAFRNEPFPW